MSGRCADHTLQRTKHLNIFKASSPAGRFPHSQTSSLTRSIPLPLYQLLWAFRRLPPQRVVNLSLLTLTPCY